MIWFSHSWWLDGNRFTLCVFQKWTMLCFDDEKQEDKNTFKDNSKSEYFIYWYYFLLSKLLYSFFQNLHAWRFIWCHISHANRIKKCLNYQGKEWYILLCWLIKKKVSYLYLVPYIFLNFFFVIKRKMWTWMMSLMSTWVKRSTYLSLENFSLNAFMLMINN